MTKKKKNTLLLPSDSDDENDVFVVENDEFFPTDQNDNTSIGVESVDIDEYLKRGGECGKFQIWVVSLIMIASLPMAFPILIFYYIGHDPLWKCNENAGSEFCRNNTQLYEHENTKRCSIPRSDWRYENNGRVTFSMEFDLICDNAWLDALSGSAIFIGWGVGSLVMGLLSDKFGRKRVMFPSYFVCLLGLLLHAFANNVYLLIVIRVITGYFVASPALNNFVLMLEVVGPNRRALVSAVGGFAFPLSGLLLTLQAYYIKNWKTLVIVCSGPYFVLLLLGFCIPESIRWLNLKGRIKDAEHILRRAAVVNKKSLPPLALKPLETSKSTSASYLDLFKNGKIIKLVFAQVFIWFNSGMTYYALSWAFADIGGDMYVNFILALGVEVPGVFITNYLMHRIGRKKTTLGMFFGTFIFCLGVAFTPKTSDTFKLVRVILGLSGKFMIANAFSCVYLWSAEIYPTIIRSQGMGINIVTSRAGAATSPFIKVLDQLHPAAPFGTVAVTSLIASLCTLVLPETFNKPTRETMNDFNDKKSVEMVAVCSMNNDAVEFEGTVDEQPGLVVEFSDNEETDSLLLTPPVEVISVGK